MHDESFQPELLVNKAVDILKQALTSIPASEIKEKLRSQVFQDEESKDPIEVKLMELFGETRKFAAAI